MKVSDYNPEGKKLTYQQHLKLMKKQQEKEEKQMSRYDGESKPWLCECGESRYSLKAVPGGNGELIRTCKNCGAEKNF